MSRWIVTLALSGQFVGYVEAETETEAIGKACVLAARSGYKPQRIVVKKPVDTRYN